jgi:hypothetical protein
MLMSLCHVCSLICRPQQLHNCGSIMIGLPTCGCAGEAYTMPRSWCALIGNWPACMRIQSDPCSDLRSLLLPHASFKAPALLLVLSDAVRLHAAATGSCSWPSRGGGHAARLGGSMGCARHGAVTPGTCRGQLGPQLHAVGAFTSGWAGCADVKNMASCVCTRVLSLREARQWQPYAWVWAMDRVHAVRTGLHPTLVHASLLLD